MQLRQSFRLWWWAPLLALIVMVLWAMDFNGLYGQDSHEYLRFSRELQQGLLGNQVIGDFYWPWGYPLVGAMLSFLTGSTTVALQLLSVASWVGTAVYLYRLLQWLYPQHNRTTNWVVLLAGIATPQLIVSGTVVMSDAMATFFTVGALYHIVRYIGLLQTKHLLLGLLFGAAAVLTRYPVGLILFFPIGLLARKIVRQKSWGHGIVLLTAGGFVLVAFSLIRSGQPFDFLGNAYLHDWSISHWFSHTLTSVDGTQSYPLPNLMYVCSPFYHPRFFFLGGLLTLLTLWKTRLPQHVWMLVIPGALYLLFVAGLPFQNPRVLLPAYVLMIPLFVPGLAWALNRIRSSFGTIGLAMMLLIQLLWAGKTLQPVYASNQVQQEVVSALQPFSGQTIYTTGIDMAFASYDLTMTVNSIWFQEYEEYESRALVLYNEARYGAQWEQMNPGKNWKRLQQTGTLDTLQHFQSGWVLYQWNPDEP